MDLQNPASQWSYHRMAYTENFVIFWEKGFGNDLSNPPQLEGHSMKGGSARSEGEAGKTFYAYFYHTLQFARQGSKCDKYRMMVMIKLFPWKALPTEGITTGRSVRSGSPPTGYKMRN